MESLLAEFVGPMAAIIMEEHETKSTSAYNLAIEISTEIPEQKQQAEFLRRWETLSASRQKLFEQHSPDKQAEKARAATFPSTVMQKLGFEFSNYVSPRSGGSRRDR